MEHIYIFGHQSPDTDSICSAIVYSEFKNKLGEEKYVPARLGELNRETTFVLNYFDAETPTLLEDGTNKKIILVDHNELSQSVPNREKAEILEVIDHHRIGNFQTANPLYMHLEPVGCTCTILYKKFIENSLPISEKLAGLMLSAILSDTLALTSPTCTEEDIMAVKILADLAEIDDYEAYAEDMLKEGSSLEGYSVSEILSIDSKSFTFGDISGVISQVLTYDTSEVFKLKNELIKEMDELLKKQNGTLSIFMLTDIQKNSSTLFVTGSNLEIAYEAFGGNLGENIELPGVVSRKKQIVPKLTEAALAKSVNK
ncbi:MAG: manganese-dependent inorganic pyrophosphatase [Defluviitaleaceae bacterium]|nr:manganese-dependent inorganic pyrophosphatase [Defluviitaleaceae bacterium]